MSMPQCSLRKLYELHVIANDINHANYHIPFSGSGHHNVKVFNVNGGFLSSLEPYSSFLQQNRSSPISTTSFHPHRMMLACSALNDNHINLFTCEDKRRTSWHG